MDEAERLKKIETERKDFKKWWSKNGIIRPIKVDLEECRIGAKKRHESFKGQNSKRLFKNKVAEELIGYCGEKAMEILTGYPMNDKTGPDNGIDFTFPGIGNANVKCTERFLNLLIKRKDPLLQNTNFVIGAYLVIDTVYFMGSTLTANIGEYDKGWKEEYFGDTYTNNWKKPLIDLLPMDKFVSALEKAESRHDIVKDRYPMTISRDKKDAFFV